MHTAHSHFCFWSRKSDKIGYLCKHSAINFTRFMREFALQWDTVKHDIPRQLIHYYASVWKCVLDECVFERNACVYSCIITSRPNKTANQQQINNTIEPDHTQAAGTFGRLCLWNLICIFLLSAFLWFSNREKQLSL
jgi:hypothetical protein